MPVRSIGQSSGMPTGGGFSMFARAAATSDVLRTWGGTSSTGIAGLPRVLGDLVGERAAAGG